MLQKRLVPNLLSLCILILFSIQQRQLRTLCSDILLLYDCSYTYIVKKLLINFKLTIFLCCVPTNEEADKGRFYNTLNKLIADVPQHDLLALTVYMNATFGEKDERVSIVLAK